MQDAARLETLIAAKYTKSRQRLLEDANLNLEILRFQMRLAKDLQCLKVASHAFAAKAIDEIRLAPQHPSAAVASDAK